MNSSQHARESGLDHRDRSSSAPRRWGMVLAGGSLAVLGLTRRSKAGLAFAAAGGALAYAGAKSSTTSPAPVISTSLLVSCSPEDAYRLWHDFENLPLFMNHLESVSVIDDRHSKWIANIPGAGKLQWNAEIDEDRQGELISWHSLPGSDVMVNGTVSFRPAIGNRGTMVAVRMKYGRVTGTPGRALKSLLGRQAGFFLRQDMRRFKALVETGEIATTDGQSHGPRSRGSAVARAIDPTRPARGTSNVIEVLRAERRAS